MTKARRSGRLRLLLGCMLGGIWGMFAAFLVAAINAPDITANPEERYEGYPIFILLIFMPGGLIVGAMIGLLAVDACEAAGAKALGWGCAGWLLSLAIGKLVFASRAEAFFLLFHGVLTCAFTVCGLLLSVSRAGKTHQQNDELS